MKYARLWSCDTILKYKIYKITKSNKVKKYINKIYS